jgi:hypothetical protein
MSPFPHVDPEALNELLSMPYDEPDMADVERVCDEVRYGLDGNGTTSAANLPARTAEGITVWDTTWPQRITEELDMEQTEPIKREKCLMVDPDGDRLMPGRCKKPLDHEGDHDWRAAHGAYLDGGRRERLREEDSPSGLLPVRVPGAALRDQDETWETSDGTAMSALHQALAEEAEERTDGDAWVPQDDEEHGTGPGGPARAARAAESNVEREVLETWPV